MWPERRPTGDECKALADVPPPNGNRSAFAAWMPQVGGHCSPCVVSFPVPEDDDGASPGCFDVEVYHDGDFPRDEKTCSLHFCDVRQLNSFAVDVLMKMGENGRKMESVEREAMVDLVRTIPAVDEFGDPA